MTTEPRWLVRRGEPGDRNFVAASWFASYFKGGECPRLTHEEYKASVAPLLDAILRRSEVFVACVPNFPDEILGYAVFEGPALHFVYVKDAFRRHGIAQDLLARRQYTHHTFLTSIGKKILKSKFNPFLMFH